MDFPRKGKPEMKKLFFAMFALAALSLLAPSSGVAQDIERDRHLHDADARADQRRGELLGTLPGQFEVYLVLMNPFNDATTQLPITEIAGFECHILLPTGFQIFGATLPPNTINFTSPPTFYVAGTIPSARPGAAGDAEHRHLHRHRGLDLPGARARCTEHRRQHCHHRCQ